MRAFWDAVLRLCFKLPIFYLAILETRPLFKRKQKLYIYIYIFLHATSKNEIYICSNKHETGLVL